MGNGFKGVGGRGEGQCNDRICSFIMRKPPAKGIVYDGLSIMEKGILKMQRQLDASFVMSICQISGKHENMKYAVQ